MNHHSTSISARNKPTTRRGFFERMGGGVYGAALTWLLGHDLYGHSLDSPARDGRRRVYDQRPRRPHFDPPAKAVIQLFMNGGPSQMDLLDPKPELNKRHGESLFDEIAAEVENPGQAGAIMRSPFEFSQHGQSGMRVSAVMPYLATCVDDIAVIRSMYTTNLTHEPALYKIHSGRTIPGLPSAGAWISYGLGSENQNLPAYVVLADPKGLPINRSQNWQSGYLPPIYQGTRFRSTGEPILNLKRDFDEPDEITLMERDLLTQLDHIHREERPRHPLLDARIASYELAARMQLAASDALDLSQETRQTLDSYGIGEKTTDSYGRRCLYARRLVERGVRFVQIFIEGQNWDHHGDIATGLREICGETDKPIAALLQDLRRRGLFDSVLVVWGGEFGRLPIAQVPGTDLSSAGRDHNKNAMCTWMAGAGVRGGSVHGATDELGMAAVEEKVSVADWHATILHLLGLHHEELFYVRNGFKEKLTSTFEANVIQDILV